MLVLPIDVVQRLSLKHIRDVTVRYGNGRTEVKGIYGVVTADLKGRMGEFDVLAEVEGAPALIGHTVLEQLDLVVDLRNRALAPNPASPDMPMIDVL